MTMTTKKERRVVVTITVIAGSDFAWQCASEQLECVAIAMKRGLEIQNKKTTVEYSVTGKYERID